MLWLDCDGVLADFCGHVYDLVRPEAPINTWTDWRLEDSFSEEETRCLDLLWESPGFWESLPEMSGAAKAVSVLQETLGKQNIACATVEFPYCFDWCSLRKTWVLDHMNIDLTVCVDVLSSKSLLPGIMLVDDTLRHLELWEERYGLGSAIAFSQPYNMSWKGRRIHSWDGPNVQQILAWYRELAPPEA